LILMKMNPKTEQDAPASASALPHVQEVLRTAQQELSGLLRQREDIMKRIGKIKQMLSGMASLFGDSILYDELRVALDGRPSNRRKGFTRACRQILMQSRTPLPLRYFVGELRRRFPDLAGRHRDLSASVTTVFHRLANYGEARCSMDETGGRVWEWVAEKRTSNDEILAGLETTVFETTTQPQPPRNKSSETNPQVDLRSLSALSEEV
jgi:hypothetical protein